MKIQNRVRAFFLAARIEYHWHHILRHRKKGCRLLAEGMPLNCDRMLRLNRRIVRHSVLAKQQEKYYELHFVSPVPSRQSCKV